MKNSSNTKEGDYQISLSKKKWKGNNNGEERSKGSN